MILSSTPPLLAPGGVLLLTTLCLLLYGFAALPLAPRRRGPSAALVAAWLLHGVLLVIDIGGFGQAAPGARLGFGPVLSMTVWLVIAMHTFESRLVPLPAIRQLLALAGGLVVLLAAAFPGEMRPILSPWAPVHFALGVASYGLFGAAVLHAAMLDAAERRLRAGVPSAPRGQPVGMPLMQLERITFHFVQAGFAVLTATLLLGVATASLWRWDKVVFSLLAWTVFAALLLGRRLRGWRGRRATRWLYVGAVLLLLGYVGSRFVLEVLLGRSAAV
jgi:ABC-type uncharacterized transport system permease subunit